MVRLALCAGEVGSAHTLCGALCLPGAHYQ